MIVITYRHPQNEIKIIHRYERLRCRPGYANNYFLIKLKQNEESSWLDEDNFKRWSGHKTVPFISDIISSFYRTSICRLKHFYELLKDRMYIHLSV